MTEKSANEKATRLEKFVVTGLSILATVAIVVGFGLMLHPVCCLVTGKFFGVGLILAWTLPGFIGALLICIGLKKEDKKKNEKQSGFMVWVLTGLFFVALGLISLFLGAIFLWDYYIKKRKGE